MSAPADVPVRHYQGHDGLELAYRDLGEGRPVLLVHGFFSTGYVNWIRYGHAGLLAETGFRVVMPDLRGHGASGHPHEAERYPKDVLADDVLALVEHLGLDEYDLGGYSLGARTVARMLVRGATPRRVVLAGMGLDLIIDTSRGEGFFRRVLEGFGTFTHGDPEFMSQAFLKTTGGDPEAMLRVLDTNVDTPAEQIAAVDVPVLVVMGDADDEHGSGSRLAEALDGGYTEIPGSHMGAVARPELGQTMRDFLTEDP